MKNSKALQLDPILTISFTLLTILGLLILASASMPMAEKFFNEPFYHFYSQLFCLFLGLIIIGSSIFISIDNWQSINKILFYFVLFSLVLVLLFGVEVNGARRWLPVPGIRVQVSEVLKLSIVLYLASFIAENYKEINNNLKILFLPILWVLISCILLLLEPDFGATVVILFTFLGMIFIAGVSLRPLVFLLILTVVSLVLLAFMSPYRFARLTTFLSPWEYAYGSGYQLTQALISYGRGDWFGLGLGGSIQKMFFLPEAHTDFIFAILSEELGLIGAVFIIFLYLLIITRIFYYGYIAQSKNMLLHSFILYGSAIYFFTQAYISIGVNLGLLPTKGLTLPLLSYGRTSLLINCAFIGLVLRALIEIKNKGLYWEV